MSKIATISLDDGGWDDWAVMTVLRKHKIPATFYLIVNTLVESSKFYQNRSIKEIISTYNGYEVGSHSVSHTQHWQTMPKIWEEEIIDSRTLLHKFFHQDINCFAYPYNAIKETMRPLIKKAGYSFARTYTVLPEDVVTSKDIYMIPISKRITLENFSIIPNTISLAKRGIPIHLGGHSYELVNNMDWMKMLDDTIWMLRSEGYKFLTNFDFFSEIFSVR